MSKIAIEFGSQTFRSLRIEGNRLVTRTFPVEFLVLEANASRKRLLSRSGTAYATCDGHFIVHGPGTTELAELLNLPLQQPFMNGQMPQEDPVIRQFLAAVISALLPYTATPQPCCVILPGAAMQQNPQESLLMQIVKLQGYESSCLSAGHALVLAENSHHAFTGLGVTLGAEHLNCSIVHHGEELHCWSLFQGGNEMDRTLAKAWKTMAWLDDGQEIFNTEKVRTQRESMARLSDIKSEQVLAVRNLYASLFAQIASTCKRELNDKILNQLPKSISLTLGGGLAHPEGVIELCQRAMVDADLPIQWDSIMLANDLEFSALRGGLIQLEMNSPTTRLLESAA